MSVVFNGNYNDYSYDWYPNTGYFLMEAMVLNAAVPFAENAAE